MNYEKVNKIDFSKFEINGNFPQATKSILDKNIVYKLMKINSGSKGEFTSLAQYMYQHFILTYNEDLINFYKAIERIAIREMVHYEMISKKLYLSDVDPKYCKYIDNNINICDYWSGHYVCYDKEFQKILQDNIKLEQIAIDDYNEVLKESNDENLDLIVKRILEDEVSHLDYFNTVLNAFIEN